MDFHISYREKFLLNQAILGNIKQWREQLLLIRGGAEQIIDMQSFQGAGAESIKNYLRAVHITTHTEASNLEVCDELTKRST